MRELTYSKPLPRRVRKAKGPTARHRAKRRRAEGPVAKAVRAACVERDGYCRIGKDVQQFIVACEGRVSESYICNGPSEWAHLESRARTRNMRPELRHHTATSVMSCRKHHDQLDGRAHPRIRVDVQTGAGADGPLTWRTA